VVKTFWDYCEKIFQPWLNIISIQIEEGISIVHKTKDKEIMQCEKGDV
jgi:hypothetical protein